MTLAQSLALIRDIPDFPKPGVVFKDITPLLANGAAFRCVIDNLAAQVAPLQPQVIACPEARGFLFGAPLAVALGIGFVPIRKPNKLPHQTHKVQYDLEYGQDALELHADALHAGQRVLLVDDVLATGGTMAACAQLITHLGAEVVGCAFLLELGFLNGAQRLPGQTLVSLQAL